MFVLFFVRAAAVYRQHPQHGSVGVPVEVVACRSLPAGDQERPADSRRLRRQLIHVQGVCPDRALDRSVCFVCIEGREMISPCCFLLIASCTDADTHVHRHRQTDRHTHTHTKRPADM